MKLKRKKAKKVSLLEQRKRTTKSHQQRLRNQRKACLSNPYKILELLMAIMITRVMTRFLLCKGSKRKSREKLALIIVTLMWISKLYQLTLENSKKLVI